MAQYSIIQEDNRFYICNGKSRVKNNYGIEVYSTNRALSHLVVDELNADSEAACQSRESYFHFLSSYCTDTELTFHTKEDAIKGLKELVTFEKCKNDRYINVISGYSYIFKSNSDFERIVYPWLEHLSYSELVCVFGLMEMEDSFVFPFYLIVFILEEEIDEEERDREEIERTVCMAFMEEMLHGFKFKDIIQLTYIHNFISFFTMVGIESQV